MEKPTPIFVDGMMFKDAREGAPEYILGSVSVNPKQFLEWAKKQGEFASEKGWLTLDMKRSAKGSVYLQLNTWKPTKKDAPQEPTSPVAEQTDTYGGYPVEEGINAEEIPF